VRRRPLALAVAVLGLALSPATLWAQEAVEPEPATPPAEEPAAEPAPPVEELPAETPPETPPTAAPVERDAGVAVPVVARQSGAGVSMVDFAFQPSSVQVTAGSSVTWSNNGAEPHTATAGDGSFDTGEVGPGSSASVSFDQAGTFSYFCSIHPDMTGGVTVLAAETDPGATGGADEGGSTNDGAAVPTEADAVASPDAAAGLEGGLPATGAETGLLAAIGLALLAFGLQGLVAQRVRA
jgi:plastocyanin